MTSGNFKLQLNFGSLVKLTTLAGFCYGIVLMPVAFFFNLDNIEAGASELPIFVFFIILGSPVVAALNGALMGVLSFPIYWWLTKRIGFSYSGNLGLQENTNNGA